MLAALWYRSLVVLVGVGITATSGVLSSADIGQLVSVGAVMVALHIGVIRASSRRHPHGAPKWLFAVDIAVAVALNLWASRAIIPGGRLYAGYGDPFGAYGIGALALWTGVKGYRVGLALLGLVMVPLQFAMAVANGIGFGSVEWARFTMRVLWLVAAVLIGHLLVEALRRGARALAAQSEEAGRQAHRHRVLDHVHNVVLQTLAGIDRRSRDPGVDPGAANSEISAECRRRVVAIRQLLYGDEGAQPGIHSEIRRLVAELEATRPFAIRLDIRGPEPDLHPDVARAMTGALGEALRNAERHAGADAVSVVVDCDGVHVHAVVRDDGRGFDASGTTAGYGVRHSISARLVEAGGQARLTTAVGRGTTWELEVPVAAGVGRPADPGPSVALLVERTLASLAFVPLSYRALGLLIAIAGLIGSRTLGPLPLAGPVIVLALTSLVQIPLLAVAGKAPWLLRNPWVIACDCLAGALLTLSAGAAMPHGTIFLDNRAPFTVYAQGSVALWAGVGSARLGAATLIAFGLPLQLGAAALNGAALTASGTLTLLTRAMWLLPAFFVANRVMSAARQGGLLLAAERRRAGAEVHRAEALGAPGETVLATLESIADLAQSQRGNPAEALRAVGVVARSQAAQVRQMLLATDGPASGIRAELDSLVLRFETRGVLMPELVACDLDTPLEPRHATVLLETLREILTAAEDLDRPRKVILFVELDDDCLSAVVNDRDLDDAELGRARAPYRALSRLLDERLASVGARVAVDFLPPNGARWEVSMTTHPTLPRQRGGSSHPA